MKIVSNIELRGMGGGGMGEAEEEEGWCVNLPILLVGIFFVILYKYANAHSVEIGKTATLLLAISQQYCNILYFGIFIRCILGIKYIRHIRY